MADRKSDNMVQSHPASTITSPDDRLSLLPQAILDTVYSFVFRSANGPWTLRIKAPSRLSQHARDPRWDSLLSILALPQDATYRDRRQENPSPKWPDNVEEAFLRGKFNLNTISSRPSLSANHLLLSSGLGMQTSCALFQ